MKRQHLDFLILLCIHKETEHDDILEGCSEHVMSDYMQTTPTNYTSHLQGVDVLHFIVETSVQPPQVPL